MSDTGIFLSLGLLSLLKAICHKTVNQEEHISRKITIFDATLCDGEQSPGASMNTEEKLFIARQLVRMNVDEQPDCVTVEADAGVEWDDLVEWAVQHELWGLENLSLIPGKVGAAPVQNIGAYGCEAKDAIRSVEMFCTETFNTLVLNREHCAFGYRDSVFKRSLRGRVIITSVRFALSRTPRPRLEYGDLAAAVEARGGITLRNIREAVCAIRRAKLPDPAVTGNAGSFFKNPVVGREEAERLSALYPDMPHYPAADPSQVKLAAGWLIDRAGLKGHSEGRVGIHPRQALVIINLGGATGTEIVAFARKVQEQVKKRFGVEIEPEVNIL